MNEMYCCCWSVVVQSSHYNFITSFHCHCKLDPLKMGDTGLINGIVNIYTHEHEQD